MTDLHPDRSRQARSSTTEQPRTLRSCLDAHPSDVPLFDGRTAAQVRDLADLAARRFAACDVAGRLVGLRMANGVEWVAALLGLLEAGAHPLLLAADSPEPEWHRLLTVAGGDLLATGIDPAQGRLRQVSADATPPASGVERVVPSEPSVVIMTSGSTGVPKAVVRSQRSLLVEAAHYRRHFRVGRDDVLWIPLPLPHAYALSWLSCALLAGTDTRLPAPGALGELENGLRTEATVAALVPSLTRLLLHRRRRRADAGGPAPLRTVVVGAGAVDEPLATEFRQAYGIGLSRVYGSTETGAVCAAGPDVPALCVGRPLPGVDHRVLDEAGRPIGAGGEGLLEVRTGTGESWQATGDLVFQDEQGRLTVLGRQANAVRRGDRWIAPSEVESVFREHPGVREARVTAIRSATAGEDGLLVEIEAGSAGEGDAAAPPGPADLMSFARERLAAYKLPNEVRVVHRLARGASGKVVAKPRYRWAESAVLSEAARAHRVSATLFALRDLGLTELLTGSLNTEEIARRAGVAPVELEFLLDTAAGLGLLVPGGSGRLVADGVALDLQLIDAEARTSRLARDAVVDVVRAGAGSSTPAAGSPDTAADPPRDPTPPALATRTVEGLRLLDPPSGARVLEVTTRDGRYLAALLRRDTAARGHLVQVGTTAEPAVSLRTEAAGRVTYAAPAPDEPDLDLCVISDAVHGPRPGDEPLRLFQRLRPGGVLLVDDRFLPESGGPARGEGLDWLVRRGFSWPQLAPLLAALRAEGAEVSVRHPSTGASAGAFVIAVAPG
ncbi:AMP-binding protein [Actinoalloteichus fjordicus]|uniref:Acyl-CoA synthetase (AMP-forming)/AMP-acid ligase II n=1 Tax=Actinoalloteichus fjordicus TaxID=1612552 RepID=A0AAC9PSD4_9PSEU|nr:AMP-binding protein [Actinoalloteichus fjordicus]APU15424.1 acyl-CoA synthetase (AMP-forming)/AMP-acid ligase II [Actinoalloteichus fjordicus]